MNLRTFNYKLNQAVLHHQAGRLDVARRQYGKLMKAQPKNPELWHLVGTLDLQGGDYQAAERRLQGAIELAEAARFPVPGLWRRRLGLAIANRGRHDEALAHYRRAAEHSEDPVDWRLLSQALVSMGKPVEAIKPLLKAVSLKEDDPLNWTELGTLYQTLGRYDEANHCHEKSLELDLNSPVALASQLGRAQVRQQLCQLPEATKLYQAIVKSHPDLDFARSHELVVMNYVSDDQADMLARHKDYGAKVELATTAARREFKAASRGETIHVGIVSPDLRAHSCAYFLAPLLRRLPTHVKVSLYYDHPVSDHMTANLAGLVGGRLTMVAHELNDQLVKRLRADKLDVAVDLAGHFSRNRLPVFAARVAPRQVTYLGYPNTTGLTTFEARLADPQVDMAGHQGHFTEPLAWCDGGLWAYEPISEAPPVAPPPTNPMFGYFGMLSKLSHQCLVVWADLCQASNVPILIKGDGLEHAHLREYWTKRLVAAGFTDNLFRLMPKTQGVVDHLKMYDQVTVALDPWPYNGTTTVCEALWQGVPTLALCGHRHASRVGAGLLRWAWLGGMAATDPSDYVRLGRELITQAPRLDRRQLQADAGWLNHDKVSAGIWQQVVG